MLSALGRRDLCKCVQRAEQIQSATQAIGPFNFRIELLSNQVLRSAAGHVTWYLDSIRVGVSATRDHESDAMSRERLAQSPA